MEAALTISFAASTARASLLLAQELVPSPHNQDMTRNRPSRVAWRTSPFALDARCGLAEESDEGQEVRERWYKWLVEKLMELARRYDAPDVTPTQTLSKLMLDHQDELFVHMREAGVSADNNQQSAASDHWRWPAR